jgi:hypothetical protein
MMETEGGGIPLLAFLVFVKVILPCFLHIVVCTKRKISTHFKLPKIYLGTPCYKQNLCRAMHLCSLLIKDRVCPEHFYIILDAPAGVIQRKYISQNTIQKYLHLKGRW